MSKKWVPGTVVTIRHGGYHNCTGIVRSPAVSPMFRDISCFVQLVSVTEEVRTRGLLPGAVGEIVFLEYDKLELRVSGIQMASRSKVAWKDCPWQPMPHGIKVAESSLHYRNTSNK